jgi:hypothetical protein
MPNVDFTLEDIQKLIQTETPRLIDQALVKEREHTRQMISEMISQSAEDVKRAIVTEFINFWDMNMGPAFDELHQELKGLHRLVDQHSKDIMELRAAR